MIRTARQLQRDQSGVAAIEAAFALPVLVTMIYGIFSIGQLFQANAGIQHALGEGARYGTLCLTLSVDPSGNTVCTLPTDDQIKAKVNSRLFGTFNGTFDPVGVDSTTLAAGYKTITVTYHQTMSFAFFTGPTINIVRSKRVYTAG
jgi:Flp pilus assembly protein TadG